MDKILKIANVALMGLMVVGCGKMQAASTSSDAGPQYLIPKATALMGAASASSMAAIRAQSSGYNYTCANCPAWQATDARVLEVFYASINVDFNSCATEGVAKKNNLLSGQAFYSTYTSGGSTYKWKAKVNVVNGVLASYEYHRCSGTSTLTQDQFDKSSDNGASASLSHKIYGTASSVMQFTGTYKTYKTNTIGSDWHIYTSYNIWDSKSIAYDSYNTASQVVTSTAMAQYYDHAVITAATQDGADSSKNARIVADVGLTGGFTDKDTQATNIVSQAALGTGSAQGYFSDAADGVDDTTPLEQALGAYDPSSGLMDVMSYSLPSLPNSTTFNTTFTSVTSDTEAWDCTIPAGATTVDPQTLMQTGTDPIAVACSAAF